MIDFGEHLAERKTLDLTPMLDVVFLLLIFFLLTSIFARPLLPLDLPEAASGQVLQEPEISLSIQRDGTLGLNGNVVTREELSERLVEMLSARSRERDISLRSDRGVPFGQVIEIMDVAKQAGAENISVVTDQKP